MKEKEGLFWAEEAIFPSLNAFLINQTLIDPGGFGFELDLKAFCQIIGQDNLKQIKRVIISHGHRDHWNNIFFAASLPQVPVYMDELTRALILRSAEFEESSIELGEIAERSRIIKPGDAIEPDIETFGLPHSIPWTKGIVIRGKKGLFVHLGDFRLMNYEKFERERTLEGLKEIGKRGVEIAALNIFNADCQGYLPSKNVAIETIFKVLQEAPGKVVITCFSTNFARIWRLCKILEKMGRPVRFFGSAMQHTRVLLNIKSIEGDPAKTVYFVTGCQAEPGSVLDVLAKELKQGWHFGEQNTLVFSSRCIPGNEKALGEMIIMLRPAFGRIIVNEGDIAQVGLSGFGNIEELPVHISGHGYAGDIEDALIALRPKSVIPWPQIEPLFSSFCKIAEKLGIKVLFEKQRVIEV